jgi:hypothetical protein
MKRGMGVFAFLAVLFAGVRVAVPPPAPKTLRTSSSPPAYVPVAFKSADTGCSEINDLPGGKSQGSQGAISALVDQYLEVVSGPSKSEPAFFPEGARLVVATVPDPLHTHLNLQFDRTIEAIQQAAQDEGYTYDSSWLPWKQHAAEYSSRADNIDEDKDTVSRERCPGLILFRKGIRPGASHPDDAPYTKGLFVFLVAEKPTTGINRTQWDNAVRWISQKTDPKTFDGALRVLGPASSGSVPSMVRALADVGKGNHFTNVLIYTTIRGCSAYQWLNDAKSDVPVRTADFDESDIVEIDRYFQYLSERGHFLSEVALLSEDETAYGGLPDTPPDADDQQNRPVPACDPKYELKNRPLHLYYPRDISTLRSAYDEQSIFGSSPSDPSTGAHIVLQPQATSTHHDTDTTATFSGSNSALAQEAQMYGVVDSLRVHGIRFVILRSTSTLDYLFLARFLHRAYPEAFIVTIGSDMLFGREIDSTEFRGVAALTVYPLLPRGQDWTALTNPKRRHAHRLFGSSTMEGTYLAARFLITDPEIHLSESRPYIHPFKPDIPDYGPPGWLSDRPGGAVNRAGPSTWLSVVGRNGYWPLAILTTPLENPGGKRPLQSNLSLVTAPPSEIEPGDMTNRSFSLSPAWKLCCMLAIVALALHCFASFRGYKDQNLSMFVQFMPLAGNRQLFLMGIGWAAIGSALVLMFLCTARIGMDPSYLNPQDAFWKWTLGVCALLGFLGAAGNVGWRSGGEPDPTRWHARPALVWIIVPCLLLSAILWAGLTIFGYFDPNGLPTAYRAVYLTSGVSPMVSLLFMLGGLYWWFWQTLCGLALLGDGRPILPRRLPVGLARISDKIARDIEAFAIPLPTYSVGRGVFYLVPLALLLLHFFALRPSLASRFETDLHSLENTPFNATLHAMFAIAFCVLVLDCAQLLSTWLVLKRLLLALNRTPLRRTFAALQGLSMNSLWSMSGTSSRARYNIFSHQLESLYHLRNTIQSFDFSDEGDDEIRTAIVRTCELGSKYIEERCSNADLAIINDALGLRSREEFRDCAELVLGKLICPQWCRETSTLDVVETAGKASSSEVLPLSDDETVRRAEEFICLIYVGYLQNLLARMRSMVLSILGIFAAIAFSLAFYPYVPRPLIVTSLLFLLLVVGSVVAFVYAGLSRDATLSHITNTEAGALGLDFWLRLASFIGVPLMGLLVTQFPGITDFVVSWIEPTINATK